MSFSPPAQTRRTFLARLTTALGALALPPPSSAADAAQPRFSREVVLEAARALAAQPFSPPMQVPDALLQLDYDQYRQIRYNKEAAIWGKTRTKFSIEMFAPGNIFNYGIDISVIENGVAVPIGIEDSTFSTPADEIGQLLAELDKVAGFRLHYALNAPSYQDEFLVFQGASYFRAVSRDQNYGLSARGLAIDVAEPGGEEFPIFRAFWVERPSARSENIVVHGLLDSQRVAGAFRFGVFPGDPTRLDVDATLFPRERLTHVGIGALTSMFLFGGLDAADTPDYRNAVHDSSGLAMQNGRGEYLWRPLNNPQNLQVSAFVDETPAGFGLAQRARNLRDFEDLEANYHRRPSAWITPKGDWGAGQVVLVEIPTRSEANDNIVAYWRPKEALVPGSPLEFSYQLTWPDDSPLPNGLGRITRTAYGLKLFSDQPQLVIDYQGLPSKLSMDDVSLEASISQGQILETQIERYGESGLRLFVTFNPQGASMAEFRVQPRMAGKPLGETMLFRWLER